MSLADKILNSPIKGLKPKETKKKLKRTSQFHFVLNTNISYKKLQEEGKVYIDKLENKLKTGLKYMKGNINAFTKCNPSDARGDKLQNFTAYLEVGPVRRFVHIDGYIVFNDFCQLKYSEIVKFWNKHLAGYSKGVKLNVQYYQDNASMIRQYAAKDKNKLI